MVQKKKSNRAVKEIGKLAAALWSTGKWYIRIAIVPVILWPVFIIAAGLTGSNAALWVALALLPVALAILAIGFVDPMVVAVLVSIKRTRGLLKAIILKLLVLFGLELAFGISLFWLRPAESPQVFLILVLIILAIITLVIGAEWFTGRTVAKITVLLMIVLVLVLVGHMYFGTNTGLEKKKGGAGTAEPPKTTVSPTITKSAAGVSHQAITVGADWLERSFSPEAWFRLDPERTIQIELLNGRQFLLEADHSLYEIKKDGSRERVPSLGSEIPGMTLRAKSEDNKPNQVVVATWSK